MVGFGRDFGGAGWWCRIPTGWWEEDILQDSPFWDSLDFDEQLDLLAAWAAIVSSSSIRKLAKPGMCSGVSSKQFAHEYE